MPATPVQGKIPLRVSLPAQVQEIIAEGIATGRWRGTLPSERRLCEDLKVSRSTLRKALRVLAQKNLIHLRHGRPTETRVGAEERTARPGRIRNVVFLSPEPLWRLRPFSAVFIDHLHEQIQDLGYHFVLRDCPAAFARDPNAALAAMLDEYDPAIWILYLSTLSIQQWFYQRGLLGIVFGSCFSGVRLPSVDVDRRAQSLHAAGYLLSRGHRNITMMAPVERVAGLMGAEEGFREAFRVRADPDCVPSIVAHGPSPDSVCRALDRVLRSKSRPTAFFVLRSEALLTMLGYFAQRGIRVPEDISLLSQNDEPLFDRLLPPLSRYSNSPQMMATKIRRLIQKLRNTNAAISESVYIMPTLIKGKSVATLNAPARPDLTAF